MDVSGNSRPTRVFAFTWLSRSFMLLVLGSTIVATWLYAPAFFKSTTIVKRLTHRVVRESLAVTITENGAVESSNNKEIKCMVKGGSTVLWVIETGKMVQPGDVLVRLDQSIIEDNILKQQIIYENAQANKISAESDVAVAKISLTEYQEGTYIEDRSKVEKEIFEAEQTLRKSELSLASAMRLTAKGVVKELQLEGEQFAVDSAKKDLELKRTRLTSLEKYNREKTQQELQSKLRAAEAKLASFSASLELERTRLEREKKQLANCILTAETTGMVIFPSMAAWKDTPDIAEGAVVREQQTLLMIPDVTRMQVKVGVHESKIDRLRVGMPAKVQMQELTLDGEVSEIAEITKPAGWWTGNLVKYDTKIKLEPHAGLKPGMSAIVDIVLAQHNDVLTIPVAAIVENKDGYYCWIQTDAGPTKRVLRLGDSNDLFTVVLDGLNEGDDVILSPLSNVEEAQAIASDMGQEGDKEGKQSKAGRKAVSNSGSTAKTAEPPKS